ncbi:MULTISPECIES: nucleotidyl transferase AbiEii/AbiGii toxin family protein [unclassified Variovorax]|uniref:nucleotidyl transferase AbiEii/AbiGii toxin family protein n=1 Tax=unclassified Variovorax TaxID=663243 RepID=UPI003ECE342E
MNDIYLRTARLLTQVAPLVFTDDTFALKGGTAINLFVRDMPRLSVDLDLVLPDHTLSRAAALEQIKASLGRAADQLKSKGFQSRMRRAPQRAHPWTIATAAIKVFFPRVPYATRVIVTFISPRLFQYANQASLANRFSSSSRLPPCPS